MKDWDIKYLNKKRYLKNCNLCIYKNVEIQDRRKEICNAWAKYRMALILTLIQLFLAVGWANGFYKKNELSFMFLLICRKYEGE